MAVKTRPQKKHQKQQGFLMRGLSAIFLLAFLGFFILLLWSNYLWLTIGYEPALKEVESLSSHQAGLVSELTEASLPLKAQAFLYEKTKDGMDTLAVKTKESTKTLNRAIEEGFGAAKEQLPVSSDASWVEESRQDLINKFQAFYKLMKACCHLLSIKATICIAAIPLFVLTGLAGLIDGLNQRAIRTASLGRESTYVFHKSIPIARKLIFWVLAFWLSLPLSMNPTGLFVALSLLLSIVMSLSASRFKKYL